MGKARILQAHGEGRYTIEIIEARERAESAKQQAEARIQTLTAEVNQLDAKIQAAQQAVDHAAIEQNAAIEQWRQEVAEQGSSSVDLDAFARKLLEAAGKRDALRSEKRSKELRIAADQALVARINALPPLRQMQAWCADYTEDLSGDVATAEVPGEIGNIIIKPGFEGANQWSATEDGAMQPALAGTPASVFYNLAMQSGWQKWRPTYRAATITSIDGDTCSISLDAATSSQQGLNVNAQSSYSGVPILYMDCNGDAFEQGDRVLVAFAGNVEGPTVVGFESEPRMCSRMHLITISDEKWDKPALEYVYDEYYTTDWQAPELVGMPVAKGSYANVKDIDRESINVRVSVSHQDSMEFSVSNNDLEGFLNTTTFTSFSHHCSIKGTVKHFGREVPLDYISSMSHSVSYTVFGIDEFDFIYPSRRKSDVTVGFSTHAYEAGDPNPFPPLSEQLQVGSYRIDLRKVNEHLYRESDFASAAEWIAYFPTKAVDSTTDLTLKGTSKPFNVLLPDMVSFRAQGQQGLMLVFSSTGALTRSSVDGYYHRFVPDSIKSQIRFKNRYNARFYKPGDPFLRNKLTDRKTHIYITLVEQEGVFVRKETPAEVLDYFKSKKIRGSSSDSYYEVPLSVNIST